MSLTVSQTNQKSLEEISALFGDTVEHQPGPEMPLGGSAFEDKQDKSILEQEMVV